MKKNPGAGVRAAWKKSQEPEPEPLNKLAGSSALLEDKKAFFWPLGAVAGAARKKYQEPVPEPLVKKVRSRSRLEKNQEPEPEPLVKKVRSRRSR